MRKPIDPILVIIAVTVIFSLVTFQMPGMDKLMFDWFALYFPENDKFRVWQIVTTMFMHGGLAHLLFNMYALWAFGTPLERIWGARRFVLFYFASGVGASIVYSLVNVYRFKAIFNDLIAAGATREQIFSFLRSESPNASDLPGSVDMETLVTFYHLYDMPAVGASGAIYGILVAFGMLFPNAKLALIFFPVPISAKYFIPVLIALDLFSGVTGVSIFGGGIAHFAHVGGALIGFLLMLRWRNKIQQ